MNKKSRIFLALACVALVVVLLGRFSGVHVSGALADFALGFGVAMLLGTLLTWNRRRIF
jgi:hypothetical protein